MASVFDTISKPLPKLPKKQSIFQSIAKPITEAASGIASFTKDLIFGEDDTSAAGITRNTITGLPKAAVDVGKDILRAPGRAAASLVSPTGFTPETTAEKFLYGKEPITTVKQKETSATETLKALGLGEKAASGISPVAVAVGLGLDLFPGVGTEASIYKRLAKETSTVAIETLLKKSVKNISEESVARIAPSIAKANTTNEVRSILKNTVKRDAQAAKAAETAVPKTPKEVPTSKLPPEKVVAPKEPIKVEVPPAKPPPELPVAPAKGGSPEDNAITALVKAITESKPAQRRLESEFTAERARRATQLEKIYSSGGGEQAYFNALGKLKGQLADKRVFDPIRDKLKQDEVSALFDKINFAPGYNVFEKTSISEGLRRVLEGEVPEPKQLEHLEDIFGHDIIKAIQSQVTQGKKIYQNIVDALNLPRTVMTSFDLSAPFRQGLLLSIRHPVKATKAFKEMFRQAFSQKNFEGWLDELKKSPDWQAIRRSGLYVADPRNLAGGLNAREESFMSKLAENIPLVKASQRAYLAYLNKLRVDTFLSLRKTFQEQGSGNAKNMESLAEYINAATGRGSLGRLGRIAPELNTVFFSPRLIASRLSFLNPVWYANQTPAVRKEAMKTMATFVGAGVTLLTLAKLGGAEVELDPRSTDFGKARVGNVRWDIWGGFQQWVRVFAQLATGQRKTTGGKIENLSAKEFPFETRHDVALRFIEGKFAPIPALALELSKGQQLFGGDITIKDTAIQNLSPLYVQDILSAYDELGLKAIPLAGVPAFFGVGVQSYGSATSAATQKLQKQGGSTKAGDASLPKLPPLPKLPKLKDLPPIK